MVKDIAPGSSESSPEDLVAVGSTLFFRAKDSFTGTELWQSDGTAAGTLRVEDVNPGRTDSSPAALTNVGGTLFFTAFNDTTGREPWGFVPLR
jgi:ELWxxDGT repeat protein